MKFLRTCKVRFKLELVSYSRVQSSSFRHVPNVNGRFHHVSLVVKKISKKPVDMMGYRSFCTSVVRVDSVDNSWGTPGVELDIVEPGRSLLFGPQRRRHLQEEKC